ncbi:MAG: AAA domain-containing protein [Bacteroidales bacterium]|nr:AAA domain-containing protein [Bacteroidales bacterium]
MERYAFSLLDEAIHCLSYYPTRCAEGYYQAYQLLLIHIKYLAVTEQLESYGIQAQLAHICERYELDFVHYSRSFITLRKQSFTDISQDTEDYHKHIATVAALIAHTTAQPLPEAIRPYLSTLTTAQASDIQHEIQKLRLVVTHWDNTYIYGHCLDTTLAQTCRVALPQGDTPFSLLATQLYAGAQLNLLHATTTPDAVWTARFFVLEPDYLIDISALSAAVKPYGTHPLNYLLHRFEPRINTIHILMGSVANQFMDDCINQADTKSANTLFKASLTKVFRQWPIAFTCSPDVERIDHAFFTQCRKQFDHIYASVQEHFGHKALDLSNILLEPAFICDTLGIRGRMDVLSANNRTLIELKSGKADEWHGLSMKDEHAIQAALYKAVLHYNFGVSYDNCEAHVFYSKYPSLFSIGENEHWVEIALQARNRIVAMERQISRGNTAAFFDELRWENINEHAKNSAFVTHYLRPPIEHICDTLNTLSPLEHAYFTAFMSFIEREQFYAKIGDNRVGSNRGFAQVWRSTNEEKIAFGEMISGMTLMRTEGEEAIERLHLALPQLESFVPNYDVGNMVMLYQQYKATDKATNQQVNNAYIEAITPHTLTLRLQYPQRNKMAFIQGAHYAIEHSTTDSSFVMMYRNLYAFLRTPSMRKNIFLAQTTPGIDHRKELATDHGDARINEVVLRAKRAEDFFLLVGPPGSGKTSRMLRAMVVEFLADQAHESDNLLLVAYTNQAVHEICEMLATISPAPHYLRLGINTTTNMAEHHISHALASANNRSEVADVIANCRIWVATLHTITSQAELFNRKHFACAIIDEASQILEPQFLGLYAAMHDAQTPAIAKFVLIGDHKQLPAVVVQSEAESAVSPHASELHSIGLTDLRSAVFERLYHNFTSYSTLAPHLVDRLTTQGRMHAHIGHFAAQAFYDNQLDVAVPERQCQKLHYPHYEVGFQTFIASTRMGFIDVTPQHVGTSRKYNVQEAKAVADIIDHLHRLHQAANRPFHAAKQVGVIVPFRNQIAMIRQQLAALPWPQLDAITIDTVECYQGSQRDYIIYSTTISTRYQLDILSTEHHGIDRKLNVALTRAKEQQFIVGQAALLRQKTIYAQLIDYCDYWTYEPHT